MPPVTSRRLGRSLVAERRDHGLGHERRGARRGDLEAELPGLEGARLEAQVGRPFEGAAETGPADHGGRAHGRQVLGAQAGTEAAAPGSA